ncbi:hypothetical protein JL720_6473 [Aureococcus anophagefferens]|nr:hypothetical protein JL720_6473 [Aureococcus anophagefferens]
MATPDMQKSMRMQYQIRENAKQQNDTMMSFASWQKDIGEKDRQQREKSAAPLPPVRGGARVGVRNSAAGAAEGASAHVAAASAGGAASAPLKPAARAARSQRRAAPGESAAKHTYDKGYKKWEDFDIDKALEEAEGDDDDDGEGRTPRRTTASGGLAQRELGNKKFAAGDYDGAIRCYTLCLGLKKHNHVAFSNRAMAYLKQKEYHNAEADCSVALSIDASHVKSLQRRATARHALGKHRAAFVDASAALDLAPGTKALATQKAAILAALREAAKNAPFSASVPVTHSD